MLLLQNRYSAPRLEAACQRASSVMRPTLKLIRNILEAGLEASATVCEPEQKPFIPHDNIRGRERFRFQAIPQEIECSEVRNLTKSQWATLLEGRCLEQGENILITGATGCVKSHIACALDYQACLMGIKTRYLNMNRLIEAVLMARTEGSYLKFLNQLEKVPLIILDDFALQSLNKNIKLALLQIIEARYAKKSLIMTAQLPVSGWYDYLDEPTLADAITDRLTARCNRLELKGESRRKKKLGNSKPAIVSLKAH